MWGPETEEDAIGGTLGSYHDMSIQEQAHNMDSNQDIEESGFVDHAVSDAGQELLLPTVTRYGLVKRYNSKLKKKIQKKRLENEDTLLGHLNLPTADDSKNSKMELERVKSDLERFFRNAGTVEVGSLKSSQTPGSYKTMNYIRDIIAEEFPSSHNQVPEGRELVYAGDVKEKKGMYSPGDWVGKTIMFVICFCCL